MSVFFLAFRLLKHRKNDFAAVQCAVVEVLSLDRQLALEVFRTIDENRVVDVLLRLALALIEKRLRCRLCSAGASSWLVLG